MYKKVKDLPFFYTWLLCLLYACLVVYLFFVFTPNLQIYSLYKSKLL